MEERNEDITIDYPDSDIIVSIKMDGGDYEDFAWNCKENHERPVDVLREFMENYEKTMEDLAEKRYQQFVAKTVDDKLISLYQQLAGIEKKLDVLFRTGKDDIKILPDFDEKDLLF